MRRREAAERGENNGVEEVDELTSACALTATACEPSPNAFLTLTLYNLKLLVQTLKVAVRSLFGCDFWLSDATIVTWFEAYLESSLVYPKTVKGPLSLGM